MYVMLVCFYVIASDRIGTVSGLVADWNKVDSVRSGPVPEHFLFQSQTMRSIFARYLSYNIVLLHRFNRSSLFTLQLPFNVTYANASYSIIANK